MENHRLRNANLSVNSSVKSIERAPLNVIKYVKIVVEEKIENLETQDMMEISDGESDVNTIRRTDEIPEKNVNNFSINSYPNKQKSNYSYKENVKPSNNDKCLPDDGLCDDDIDSVSSQEKEFCINIYNLLSAKESLV